MTEQETAVCRRFLEGATYSQIARELRMTRGMVARTVANVRARGQITLRKPKYPYLTEAPPPTDPGPPPLPPTAAMIRLAQFDPVVARAVELRTALAA